MLTFQQLVLELQSYWGAKGCVLLQPYDMEMGAGTFHTATFPTGNRPGAVARRVRATVAAPEGRALRRQPQSPAALLSVPVVLKPSPDDIQDLYLIRCALWAST